MEASGVVERFQISLSKKHLPYTQYIGNRDSKAYREVVKSDSYPGFKVKKLECVGHIQIHRFGTRLRKLKTSEKGVLDDGKSLGGKRHLIDKAINNFQNYFGLAIRKNTSSTVYQLKKDIGAVLFHRPKACELETIHKICLSDSWCKYEADKIHITNSYKENIGLPTSVKKKIYPIFMDLNNDNLLQKFLLCKNSEQ